MKQLCTYVLLLTFAQTSLAQLSGPLSGTLGPGEFHVVGTISVESGDSLRLMPGTIFRFDGPYPFEIYGTLLAEGVEGDSIVFTTDTLVNPDRWRGLRFFNDGSSGGRLAYCVIENGLAAGPWPSCVGGGVYCQDSSPAFTHCAVYANQAVPWQGIGGAGGGVYCDNSAALFTNCNIQANSADGGGGGAFCYRSSANFVDCSLCGNFGGGVACWNDSSTSFTNCIMSNNSAAFGGGVSCSESSPRFTDCTVSNNSGIGGGVYCFGSSPNFVHCLISNNQSPGFDGGGVFCDHSSPSFTNCALTDNWTYGVGGGIDCEFSFPEFTNCTFSGNWAGIFGGALFCCYSLPTLTNCTMIGNSAREDYGGGVYCDYSSLTINSTIIAFSQGDGIHFGSATGECRVAYCNFFNNSSGDIVGNGPPGLAELITTNANGDSCDTYYNIFLDPMFADTAAGDFHLMEGSPCIDGGDPELPYDPDSTIADIGALYYHHDAAEMPVALVPTSHALHPNWPNPFNPTTTIRYDVKQTGQVQLTIFNLLGQRVATLTDGKHLAGSYTISWNASDLPSGIYLCRMETPGFMQTRKLVLLK